MEDPDEMKEQTPPSNILCQFSTVVDKYIYEIRFVTYGLATVGVILTARSVYAFKQFHKACDIPSHYIQTHCKLHGVVKHIQKDGKLLVEHTPLIKLPLLQRKPERDYLPLILGGINIHPTGIQWLEQTFTNKGIWFRLLEKVPEDAVACTVMCKKYLVFNRNVNEEIVQRGEAQVLENWLFPNDKTCNVLLQKLIKAELYAQRKGHGIWRKPTMKETARQLKDNTKQSLFTFLSRIKDRIKGLFFWRRHTKK